jgi:peptide/nickel transport system permease protein
MRVQVFWNRKGILSQTDFINIGQVANVRVLPLGTDNFGRDILTELVSATATSLRIGFIAGLVATMIGLILGLMAGYIGGWVDDIIMFITNLFTSSRVCVIDLNLVQYWAGATVGRSLWLP